jgi:hypothetical protein
VNTHHCCQPKTRAGENARRPASRLRGGEIAGWVLPGATLVLLPKCPVCVAAYIALFSGVGISVATATYLRTSLLILCVTALAWLALKRLCRLGVRSGGGFAPANERDLSPRGLLSAGSQPRGNKLDLRENFPHLKTDTQ